MDRKKPFPWLRILVHILGWLPLGILAYLWFADKLTINPIQDVEQRLGRIAIYWLVGALSVTPIYTLTGWRELPARRRATGLYAFMYVCLHLLVFLGVDYGFVFSQIFALILGKVYLLVGLLSLLLLIPLAATSFDYFKRKMGKNWKRLHWLVYPAVMTAILHYALAKKGNIFSLQGDILAPFLWGLLTLFLLGLRIPPVRRWVSMTRRKVETWARQKRINRKIGKSDPQLDEKGRI
jgi:methionine sulfoxide reductase heme-binding subunit